MQVVEERKGGGGREWGRGAIRQWWGTGGGKGGGRMLRGVRVMMSLGCGRELVSVYPRSLGGCRRGLLEGRGLLDAGAQPWRDGWWSNLSEQQTMGATAGGGIVGHWRAAETKRFDCGSFIYYIYYIAQSYIVSLTVASAIALLLPRSRAFHPSIPETISLQVRL